MDFDITHHLTGFDLETVERLYFDEPYNEAMCAALKLRHRLARLEKRDGVILREVEVAPNREVPAAVRKLLGGQDISYTETLRYELGTGLGTWQTVSSVMADKIDSAGELQFASAGGGVDRRVVGHVRVRVFGIGKVIEKFIVADVQQGYAAAAQFMQNWEDKVRR